MLKVAEHFFVKGSNLLILKLHMLPHVTQLSIYFAGVLPVEGITKWWEWGHFCPSDSASQFPLSFSTLGRRCQFCFWAHEPFLTDGMKWA
jgi:hypothetical protein